VAVSFIGGGNRIEDPEKTTDLLQVTDKINNEFLQFQVSAILAQKEDIFSAEFFPAF
jgi:hypothetical protein